MRRWHSVVVPFPEGVPEDKFQKNLEDSVEAIPGARRPAPVRVEGGVELHLPGKTKADAARLAEQAADAVVALLSDPDLGVPEDKRMELL